MDQMRKVYADTLGELAEKDSRIVVLDADLMIANGTKFFQEKYPDRAFDIGAAEANMIGIAAGLSTLGKIPFASTFACFAGRRVYDQFFLSCGYAMLNVKLVGTDPGITATNNGGTHMGFEDIGLMRMIPGIVILEPSDNISLKALLPQAAYYNGCVYMRIDRKSASVLYEEGETFEIGKAKILRDGTDCTIAAAGIILVPEAMKAAEMLNAEGISAAVLDIHTVKPLDEETILAYAEKTELIVTCENHRVTGGLGSAVMELLSRVSPVPMRCIGVGEEFGRVGDISYLKEYYGMTAENIYRVCMEAVQEKMKKEKR